MSGKKLPDGSIEFTIKISPEDQARIAELEKEDAETKAKLDAEEQKRPDSDDQLSYAQFISGLPDPFRRKTRYCVECETGKQHNMRAYGDIHAAASAAGICVPYQLHKGRCKRR